MIEMEYGEDWCLDMGKVGSRQRGRMRWPGFCHEWVDLGSEVEP